MTAATVHVVDYGVGNLLSISRALAAVGAQADLSGSASRLAQAERILLPGVGAFGKCMAELRQRRLIDPLIAVMRSGRPVLGVCVGMQVLMTASEEFGDHDGLGLIEGRVVPVPNTGADGVPHKIPHIGWSALRAADNADWRGTILDGVVPGESCYFVHSFHAAPADDANRLAECDYDGRAICAAVRAGNVFGTQFHPEKSGSTGLKILANFLAIRA